MNTKIGVESGNNGGYYESEMNIIDSFEQDEIKKQAKVQYLNAKYSNLTRYPLGEEKISKDAWYSYLYARGVLKGRFLLGEPVLSQSDYWDDYQSWLSTL